ncbi:hypothetical protein MICAF_790003 [Microcystis aeruginosa PCC 9807]|uniref:Uncharacterized protein n=1 Tax=Microcystis aeruginosa PCC 9807 TaxID=1160283 RepID=I4HES8_MICAE|nr:hypothetical protein [Microcystis aeruginosa]CCI20552.1 hypothetical protein MICAF_790003 [Microcystis aeruginosa PCC 9807]
MPLTLNLTSEIEQYLSQKAREKGLSLEAYALKLLKDKYLGKINYTYLTPLLPLASCLLPIFTRKLILHDYLLF